MAAEPKANGNSNYGSRRRSSIIEQFIEKLDEREKKGQPHEPLGPLGAAAVPSESGQFEAVVRHAVSNGIVPFIFGFALQKGRVFEPKVIQDVLLLRDFTMMSMFLSAVSTSQLIFAALNAIPEDSSNHILRYIGQHFRRIKNNYQTTRGSQRGTTASATGAALLGTGMALAGACPGTVFAQAGSGVPGAELVLAGGLLGVGLFTALERKVLPEFFNRSKAAECKLEKALEGSKAAQGPKPWYTDYSKLALATGLALGAVSIAFNKLAPNSTRYSAVEIKSVWDALKAPSWNPVVAGTIIGTLQVPMFLFADTFLGTTSQFLSFISPLQPIFKSLGLADSSSEISKWSPVLSLKTVLGGWGFVTLMGIGAYTASSLAGTRNVVPGLLATAASDAPSIILSKTHPVVQPILAGVLLWFGSRVALGCTSGHGISGFSLLSVNSVVAVASMFGAGIAAAQVLENFV